MFIELETIFNIEGASKDFSYEFTPDDCDIIRSVNVDGCVKNRAGIVSLEGNARVTIELPATAVPQTLSVKPFCRLSIHWFPSLMMTRTVSSILWRICISILTSLSERTYFYPCRPKYCAVRIVRDFALIAVQI